jgi:hypothetical protein
MKRLLLASVLTLGMVTQSLATGWYPPPYPPPKEVVPPGSTGNGVPWVIPCIIGGAAGIILAAVVVGRTQNRELTQGEAMLAGFTCGVGALFVGYAPPPAPAPVRTKF